MIDYDFQIKQLEEIMKTKKDGGVYYRPDQSLQWNFTPGQVLENLPKTILQLKNSLWCVIINVEICIYLNKLGVPFENITYLADCKEREWLAKAWGVKNVAKVKNIGKKIYIDIKDMKKKFDGVVFNSDFSDIQAFRSIAESLSKRFVVMITDTAHFQDNKGRFDKVVEFKYLGDKVFPTAQITAARAVVDVTVNGKYSTVIKNQNNESLVLKTRPLCVPGPNLKDFAWAQTILSLSLKGYDAFYGDLYYNQIKEDLTGIPIIFNTGREEDKDFSKVIYMSKKLKEKATGLGRNKAIVNKNGALFKLGPIKFAGEEYGTGHNAVSVYVKDKKEFDVMKDYLQSEKVKRLIKVLKSATIINGVSFWKLIPHHSEDSKWQ